MKVRPKVRIENSKPMHFFYWFNFFFSALLYIQMYMFLCTHWCGFTTHRVKPKIRKTNRGCNMGVVGRFPKTLLIQTFPAGGKSFSLSLGRFGCVLVCLESSKNTFVQYYYIQAIYFMYRRLDCGIRKIMYSNRL